MNIDELRDKLNENDHGDSPVIRIEIQMPDGNRYLAYATQVEYDDNLMQIVIRNGKP